MEKLTPEQVKAMSDTEQNMEKMMKDTITRMMDSCTSKCLKGKTYETSDIVKTEGVCLDRCVAKYLAFTDTIGKQITQNKDTVDLLSNPPYMENKLEV